MPYTRKRIWEIIEPSHDKDTASHCYDVFLTFVIIIGVLGNITYSEPWLDHGWAIYFGILEIACTVFFLVEYITRLVCCVEDPRYNKPFGRLKWAVSAGGVIDLLALIPTFLWFLDANTTILRIMRLIRLLRLRRYNQGMRMIEETFKACRGQLYVAFSGLLILVFISAGLLHYLERDTQPIFNSFYTALWWAIVTITTVGYGDIYPVTSAGRFIASIISVLGICSFALPTGIIAAHFKQLLDKKQKTESEPAPGNFCPHCGKDLHKP